MAEFPFFFHSRLKKTFDCLIFILFYSRLNGAFDGLISFPY